ncbi:conserved Plasmodium protein, unknown function [Plasmodium malariae]|uniref:Uncharacterized protein n=2 Tax=Plasmodium malariae TaxID=5858 RepID=A0A1D3TCX9_PLAMA|nr:conserved Plasmodium protein, unknown function [Plasmodium malariae]SCP02755.1 conserved Plasmodium protein, unknown function [Plasmodium malariae]
MNENQKDNEKEAQRDSELLRESLLDDQFEESSSNRFLLFNNENPSETDKTHSQQKLKAEKPYMHKNLMSNFSVEKCKEFLSKMEKSNKDINSMDAESIIIDKDILDHSNYNNDKACVVMDVSMGIFDVHNENLSECKLNDMNITVSEVVNRVNKNFGQKREYSLLTLIYESDEQHEKDLIQEI